MSVIIEETLSLLKTAYGERFDEITIQQVNAGIFMTVVKLSTGFCGMSVTDVDKSEGCHRSHKKYFGSFSPGQVTGQKVSDLFLQTEGNELLSVFRLAVMNALSAEIIARSSYNIIENTDPVDLISPDTDQKICIVGAFQSYIKRFAESGHHLSVLELNENALAPDQRRFFVPASGAAETLNRSNVIIITGSTLVNNTLEGLLAMLPQKATVVVVGPSGSLLPDILFRNKVNIIGATRIIDPDLAFTMVGEGAAGYHMFRSCAQKICLLNE